MREYRVGKICAGYIGRARACGYPNLPLCCDPATMRAKQPVQEGFLGTLLSFRVRHLHSGNADPAAPLNWKLSAARVRSDRPPGLPGQLPVQCRGRPSVRPRPAPGDPRSEAHRGLPAVRAHTHLGGGAA